MADSFDGQALTIENANYARTASADVSVHTQPGQPLGSSYIDVGGAPPRTVSYDLFFTLRSAYESLEGLVGTVGLPAAGALSAPGLTLMSFDFPSGIPALLTALTRTRTNLDGSMHATADFLLLQ